MYEYNAIIDRVIDGDTINCTVDLGFHTWKKITVRLEGIDTPECRTRDKSEKKLGLASKNRLQEILHYNNNKCILKVSGIGKYGRAIATVFVETLSPVSTASAVTLIDVNTQLVEEGYATKYDNNKK